VVKVILQKAASLPHIDGSVVFAGGASVHPHPTHTSMAHPSPNPKRHLDRFSRFTQLTAASR